MAVVAVTLNEPAVELAVIAGDWAVPSAPLWTCAGSANVTLGPLAGAVNVTEAEATGLFNTSVTITVSCCP